MSLPCWRLSRARASTWFGHPRHSYTGDSAHTTPSRRFGAAIRNASTNGVTKFQAIRVAGRGRKGKRPPTPATARKPTVVRCRAVVFACGVDAGAGNMVLNPRLKLGSRTRLRSSARSAACYATMEPVGLIVEIRILVPQTDEKPKIFLAMIEHSETSRSILHLTIMS